MAVLKIIQFVNIGVFWDLTNDKPVDPNETRTFAELQAADALAAPPPTPDTVKQQRRKAVTDKLRVGTINNKNISDWIRVVEDITDPIV